MGLMGLLLKVKGFRDKSVREPVPRDNVTKVWLKDWLNCGSGSGRKLFSCSVGVAFQFLFKREENVCWLRKRES